VLLTDTFYIFLCVVTLRDGEHTVKGHTVFTGIVLSLPSPYARCLILFSDAVDISESEVWNYCVIVIREMEIIAKEVGAV
jgi:hypothetical protein